MWWRIFFLHSKIWGKIWHLNRALEMHQKSVAKAGDKAPGYMTVCPRTRRPRPPRRVTNHAKVQNRTSSIARSRCSVGLPCQPVWSLKPSASRARRRRRWCCGGTRVLWSGELLGAGGCSGCWGAGARRRRGSSSCPISGLWPKSFSWLGAGRGGARNWVQGAVYLSETSKPYPGCSHISSLVLYTT
jgi:hypothetical protein